MSPVNAESTMAAAIPETRYSPPPAPMPIAASAKIAAAVVEILDQISNEAEMNEQPDLAPPSNGGHYRELAGKLRLVAHQCRFPGARQEMLNLAIKYEQRANYFDQRSQ